MQFEVTGVFDTGMYEYDNAYVFVALDQAQEFAGLGDGVTGIEVKTPNRWEARRRGDELAKALRLPYRTVDWQEQNNSLFQALKLEKLGMGLILLLIVLVAAFNIVSTLTMVVTDKTREIGILKAMGMTSASVRRIFFAQGLVIGLVGTRSASMLGIAASLALGKYQFITLNPEIYFIDHLPVATAAARHRVDHRREHWHCGARDALSGDAGGASVSDRGNSARVTRTPTMNVLEAHDIAKTYRGGDGSTLHILNGVNLP